MVSRGTILGGRYAVERVLGQGGMGVVVAARHVGLQQRVAIKMLLAHENADTELLRRFERESRSVAELSSEHVARVTDIGTFEDGSPFMVMEYLEGEDLQARIDRDGPLPIALAVRLFAQAAIGLGDAHEHHVIHRDVKPSNLFLTRRRSGRIVLKVLDFGIAKADDEPLEASMTSVSSLIGSPQYMSPEQLCDPRAVGPRTDIWSLGASFYEAIGGCPAFPADSLPELHMKVLAFEPPCLSTLRRDCPPELDRIVQRCLAKESAQRFASMSDVQHALEELEASGLVGALPPESSPLVTSSNVPVVALPGLTTTRGRVSGPPAAMGLGASTLPAPPRAIGAARPRTTLSAVRDPAVDVEPSEVGAAPAPRREETHENVADGAAPRAPLGAASELRVTLVAALVAALTSSIMTFSLTRAHIFEADLAAPASSSLRPRDNGDSPSRATAPSSSASRSQQLAIATAAAAEVAHDGAPVLAPEGASNATEPMLASQDAAPPPTTGHTAKRSIPKAGPRPHHLTPTATTR